MNWKRFFKLRRSFKSKLLDEKYRIVEAFKLNGETYWMFENQMEVPTGRMLMSLAIYTEMEMRCDKEYLQQHTKAMRKVLSDRQKIDLSLIMQMNIHLEERLELMPLPEFVYKLASVVFFDSSESAYSYDYKYNEKKIEKWKKQPETLDFFLSRLSEQLIPSLRSAKGNSQMYFQVAEQIDKTHRRLLTKVLSEQK